MTGILDHIAKTRAAADPQRTFQPATPGEFFALRLATRLGDAAAVRHYIELYDRCSETRLLAAQRLALKRGSEDPARTFHQLLEQGGKNGNGTVGRDLAAIRIERRAIAVAIFSGQSPKYPPIARQLSSDPDKALGSAAMFLNRIHTKCPFQHAAIELLPPGSEAQRSQLAKVATDVLNGRQVAIWQFAKTEVIAAFGYPPLRFRNQVREVMAAMWPDVKGTFGAPLLHDALALGLYAQTEGLFLT
jgi:hypothetical protein